MTNQVEQQQDQSSELIEVNDLDHFITLLTDWHNRQVNTVLHLRSVPAGITVKIGDGDDTKDAVMEGDFLAGFQLGLDLALNYLGTLPFMAEYQDDEPTQH